MTGTPAAFTWSSRVTEESLNTTETAMEKAVEGAMARTTEKTPPYCSSSDSSDCTAHASRAQRPTAQFRQ
ncbi:hypothetical protein MC885_007666, partial [Smutsia gigantea]